MKRACIREVELKRYVLLRDVVERRLTLKEAAELMGLSYRQALRLKKRFLVSGIEGLIRKIPSRPPNLKITEEIKEQILQLRRQIYKDLNILHFKDKLLDNHGIQLSYETLRKILIEAGQHEPKKRRRVYRRRRRMPKAGMLVQMDSSEHRWIEDVEEPWWFVGMIDDADSYVYGRFYPKETVWANMEVIKEYIRRRGKFMALYVDRASHFKTTRHGGLHYNVSAEQGDTQIQRALKELNIEMINAHSPQAKGRIERLFGFFQDRLIKEMRLKGIKRYEEANRFLEEEFLPWYNSRYTLEVESVYRPVEPGVDLELVFTKRYWRKAGKDNVIRYQGRFYQLVPSNGVRSFAGKWIEVCEHRDGKITLLYEGKKVSYLSGVEYDSLRCKKTESRKKTQKRQWKPPENHPWKRCFNVTFQTGNKV